MGQLNKAYLSLSLAILTGICLIQSILRLNSGDVLIVM